MGGARGKEAASDPQEGNDRRKGVHHAPIRDEDIRLNFPNLEVSYDCTSTTSIDGARNKGMMKIILILREASFGMNTGINIGDTVAPRESPKRTSGSEQNRKETGASGLEHKGEINEETIR